VTGTAGSPAHDALVELGRALDAHDYRFTAVTPATHARVLRNRRRAEARTGRPTRTLRDIFGWNETFRPSELPEAMIEALRAADGLHETDGGYRSAVRFASWRDLSFVHSSYPTEGADAVFFGPDTYRYLDFLDRVAGGASELGRVVDVGSGSGAGGLSLHGPGRSVVLTDINPLALAFGEVNADLNHLAGVESLHSDVLAAVDGPLDMVISNPPYMRDERARTYRDGGGDLGEALAVRIVAEAAQRLRAGGRLILYTGTAIVDGHDVFERAVRPMLSDAFDDVHYAELDPDVFGEQLDETGYRTVERIAAVGLQARRR